MHNFDRHQNVNKDEGLKALFVSAPEFRKNLSDNPVFLGGRTPYVALCTVSKILKLISQNKVTIENWKTPQDIKESILLMQYWEEEKEAFIEKLKKTRPSILFISTFSINFPGAIEIAKIAKDILGKSVLVILGGRHPSETFYIDISLNGKFGEIYSKSSNPLELMQNESIPSVFDIVVSNDGTDLVQTITETCIQIKLSGGDVSNIMNYKEPIRKSKGYFIAGVINKVSNSIEYIYPEKYIYEDANKLDSPYLYTGPDSTHFSVFKNSNWTAHVHSDWKGVPGNTCTLNCGFCSEASGKNPIRGGNIKDAPYRLFSRFCSIMQVGESYNRDTSIFIEDSILLGGHKPSMIEFLRLLKGLPIDERPREWGCQMTVTQLTDPGMLDILKQLKDVGLAYIFFGIENVYMEMDGFMHKATIGKGKEISWKTRSEEAVRNLFLLGIRTGISNIFCMTPTENQKNRIDQLNTILGWQKKYPGTIQAISLNLLTLHPSYDQGFYPHNYKDWGEDENELKQGIIQELFGEGGVTYLAHPQTLPTIEDLYEIRKKVYQIQQGFN